MSARPIWKPPNWCRFTEEDRQILVESLRRLYPIRTARPTFYTPVLKLFASAKLYEKRLNHKLQLVRLLKALDEVGGHRVYRIEVRPQSKRGRGRSTFQKTALFKEIPLLPLRHHGVLELVLKEPTAAQLANSLVLGNLYALENSAYVELLASFLCSNLYENGQSPHFGSLYGSFSVILPRYRYREDTDSLEANMLPSRHRLQVCDSFSLVTIPQCPIHTLVLEKLEYSLMEVLEAWDPSDQPLLLESVVFQVTAALSLVQSRYQLRHNDLHLGNLMCRSTRATWFWYRTGEGKHFRVPSYGYEVVLIDWGRATLNYEGNDIGNSCFGADYEVFGQYYTPLMGPRSQRRAIQPHDSFDLAVFLGSLVEYLKETPDWIRGLTHHIYGVPLEERETSHFKGYVSLVRDAACLEPSHVLRDSVFRIFHTRERPLRDRIYEVE